MASKSFPRINLPDSSMPWARAITEAARDQQRQVDNLINSTQADNRTIAAQLGTLGSTVTALSNTVNTLNDNVNFLLNQIVSDSKNNQYTANNQPASVSYDNLLPYDSTYDPRVQITVPSSGSFRVEASARLYAFVIPSAGSFVRAAPGYNLVVESTSKNETIVELLYNAVLANAGTISNETHVTVSGFAVFTGFTPGQTCTITLRRKWRGDASGTPGPSTQQFGRFSQPAISATLIR